MNEKINQYLNGVFAPYDGVKSVAELKADLLADLQERFRELKAEGKDDETAFAMTIDSIGDIEQTVQEVASLSRSLERQVHINFSASNLPKSDFAGVSVHKGKFEASDLRGSDFSGADLTGTEFNTSDLTRAKFSDVKLIDVKLTTTDLRETIFENCIFSGVDFKTIDLRGVCFDGQTFIGVKFDMASLNEASFKGATFKNVSFLATVNWYTWSKKHYRAIKTINFDGATMDKLTYATLKGLEADLSKVIVI